MATANGWVDDFVRARSLPASWHARAGVHLDTLAGWLNDSGLRLIGISGAQGTGKSSVSDYLAAALEKRYGRRTCVLSLDDYYVSKSERLELAEHVHPLLATRGVPGTHDIDGLSGTVEALLGESGGELRIPVFDKGSDDRLPAERWRKAAPSPDFVLLEGWCIGARAQTGAELEAPINALEATEDPDGSWRRWVNEQLALRYEPLYDKLDALVFLQVPGLAAVLRWRGLQEHKLIAATGKGMSDAEIARFIGHYERLTRSCLQLLPGTADACIELDDDHNVASLRFRNA
ncbi:MAG: hypothetical protein AAFX56_13930 [Pseudomonadota bacterium]